MVWYVAVATTKRPHATIFLLLLELVLFFFLLSSFSIFYVCFVRLGFVVEGTSVNGCVEDRTDPARLKAQRAFRVEPKYFGITKRGILYLFFHFGGRPRETSLACLLIGELWWREVDQDHTRLINQLIA